MKQYQKLRQRSLKLFQLYLLARTKKEKKEIAARYKFNHDQLRMCATIYGIDKEKNLLTFKPA